MNGKRALLALLFAFAATPTVSTEGVDPDADKARVWEYFAKRYSDIAVTDYVNGIYVFDDDLFEQWQEAEANFPEYEDDIAVGEREWGTPFANGKTYAGCFPEIEIADLRAAFPYYDEDRAEVITLELALNECRERNGASLLSWRKGLLAQLAAYVAYEGRGQTINPKVDSEGAKRAYLAGKRLFYGKRGQLNLACADCHVYYAGRRVRTNTLSSVIGQVSHFPAYRKKWEELGTLHRRYYGCQKNIRARPFAPQSLEYRNLEFFHTYMSKGLKWNGPQTRG